MSDTTTNDIVVPLGDEVEISPRASSGTIVNNFRTGYKVQISWTVNSQDIANNKSNITVKAQLVSTGSAYTISSSATKNGSLTINGTTYSFTFTAGLSGSQTKTVYTKTVDISHGSDGTKTVSMSASLGINVTLSGTYWGTVTASGSGVLDTIPRTSSMSLSASTATLGSTSITVNITRASTSFTHKVYCKIGSYSKTLSTSATTSVVFTPELAIANQIPNSTSGSATIEVQTYNGSTKIGSVTKTLKVNVPSSVVPTIGSFTATTVAAGAATSYGYVKGLSKCTLAMGSVAGSYSSTIASYSISGGGFSSTKSSFTTGVLNTAGNITFTATVTDSRGRTASKTVSITVYDYAVPNISKFTVQRCNSSGTVTDDGTYLKIGATYSFSSVNSKNSAVASVVYKKSTATAWVDGGNISNNGSITIGANTIDTGSSYDVKLIVTDSFNATSKSVVIPTSYAIIDIRKGGKGISFGKMSESDDLFDIGMTGLRVANARANYLRSYDNSKVAIQMTDGWLRFNPSNHFASGIYCNTGILRTDGNLQVGASGGTFNCSSSAFTYKGNAVYHAGNKPTTADISAMQGVYTNGYWGMGAPNGDTNTWIRTTSNGLIPYQSGSSSSSIGTSSWRFANGYFGSLDASGSLTTGAGATFGQSITIGSYEETWRGVTCKRLTSGQNYAGRYAVSYVNSLKQTSSSTAVLGYGASIECHDGSSAVRRVLLCQNSFIPMADNNTYLGASSHRWQAVYATTGSVYSSSKDEKEGIEPLSISTYSKSVSYKDVIRNGIKNTPMYSYKYRALNNDDTYVGFLGQELEEQDKEFFDLIGSSYTTEEGNKQYDIRESSVIGVLWSALQDVLVENEQQEERIKELEDKVENLTNEIQQIKDMLGIA